MISSGNNAFIEREYRGNGNIQVEERIYNFTIDNLFNFKSSRFYTYLHV